MTLQNEPAPTNEEEPASSLRSMTTLLKGLGLGLLAAFVSTLVMMPQKGPRALLIPGIAFLGTFAVWILINYSMNRSSAPELDSSTNRESHRRNRMLLAIAAFLAGPFGGAWVGFMIVLFAEVSPMDRAITIGAPAFLGLVAGAIVASAILVSSFLE